MEDKKKKADPCLRVQDAAEVKSAVLIVGTVQSRRLEGGGY